MLKKIFIIAIIFFLIAAGVAIYTLFFHHATNQNQQNNSNSSSNYQPFPLSNSINSQPPNTLNGASTGTSTTPITIQPLTQLYPLPIAGAGIFATKKDGEFVRFTDRATGHIYSISLATSSAVVTNELSDQTIPQIYRSLWLNGSTTILQYLDNNQSTIKTYSATLGASKEASTSTPTFSSITGTFLPDDIEAIATNPTGNQIFYLIESASGVIGKITNYTTNNNSTIFSSPISDWNIQWPTTSTIALSTKASNGVNGYLYFLSTKGTLQRILGDIPGLVTNVNPTGTLVAYSDGNPTLSMFDIKSNTTINTGLATIANKCAWSPTQTTILYCAVPNSLPGGNYPDAWYQGLVSFSDSIYSINATTGQSIQIGTISQQAGQPIDAENLMVSPNNDFLIFTNKIDLSLWALRLQ